MTHCQLPSLPLFTTPAPFPKPLTPNPPKMAPLPLRLQISPKSRSLTLNSLRPFSSSSPPFPNQNPNSNPNPDRDNGENASPFPPPPRSPSSSIFSDIKERLRSPQPPPRRFLNNPPPPPTAPPVPSPSASLDEIRKHLAEFRLGSSPTSNASPSPGPPQGAPTSFQDLFNRNPAPGPGPKPEGGSMSYESIRESLRKIRPSSDTQKFRSLFGPRPDASSPPLIGDQEKLPESIFGREMREKLGENDGGGEGEAKELKTEFVKAYTHEDLGEKLRFLRPDAAQKGKKGWFSLDELNLRLAKLRELEEKESSATAGTSGGLFHDLRMSLKRLKDSENSKKANINRMSILAGINLSSKPKFMLNPPQEHLLENYFHPDHMSSAEKMKLELKKVRDEFKMSESDCGSARVQIAQLTTKIKHLASVLHKKDKHSRKGLNEMVQRRKKILKYLRRTDWDSYCFVLSKLGLRDIPEYKVPDYKVKVKVKVKA